MIPTTSAERFVTIQSVAVKANTVKVTPDKSLEGVMKIHKTLLIGLCATASFAGLSIPAVAGTDVSIHFRSAPPPMRYEHVPAPRRGYVWINGYWDVKRHRHVWNKGHWKRARAGYYYAQPTWVQSNRRWELQRGEWRPGERDYGKPNRYDHNDRDRHDRDRNDHKPNRFEGDRDRDGVPNRVDRDRDGDGVNNRRDDAPSNPRRY
jgi:hypothetical protein